MTLAEFLLARIDDDEAYWRGQSRLEVSRLMLAKLQVERRLVEMHSATGRGDFAPYCPTCDDTTPPSETVYPCTTVRLLALPYATWPDYREEWRP